jgi:hypothetical protein
MAATRNWTDKTIEEIVGNLLRTGVSVSAFVVSVGAVISLVRHGRSPRRLRIARPRHHPVRTPAAHRHPSRPRSLLHLGLRRRRRSHVHDLHRHRPGGPSVQPARLWISVLRVWGGAPSPLPAEPRDFVWRSASSAAIKAISSIQVPQGTDTPTKPRQISLGQRWVAHSSRPLA